MPKLWKWNSESKQTRMSVLTCHVSFQELIHPLFCLSPSFHFYHTFQFHDPKEKPVIGESDSPLGPTQQFYLGLSSLPLALHPLYPCATLAFSTVRTVSYPSPSYSHSYSSFSATHQLDDTLLITLNPHAYHNFTNKQPFF